MKKNIACSVRNDELSARGH